MDILGLPRGRLEAWLFGKCLSAASWPLLLPMNPDLLAVGWEGPRLAAGAAYVWAEPAQIRERHLNGNFLHSRAETYSYFSASTRLPSKGKGFYNFIRLDSKQILFCLC